VFSTNTRQTCKVVLERRGTKAGSFPVRIESILIPDETAKQMLCQSVLINHSESHDGQEDQRTSETDTPKAQAAAEMIVAGDAVRTIASLHKAAERIESLREERDFAERLLAAAPAIVLVLDLDGRIVRFNRCFEDLTGYRLEEVRGTDWFSTFLPGNNHEQVRGAFMRTLWGEIAPATVNLIRTRTGSILEIEWHSALLRDARGNVNAALSIGLDLTPRQPPQQS
jgi:PAS domain S-box-containing protein